ncbi:MAG: protein kinase [Blastocatellia bacterium]|nr:protein kinase [Blastocatellia bacterium]
MYQAHQCAECEGVKGSRLCAKCLLRLGLESEGNTSGEEVIAEFGDYELLQEIAKGGMGVVYRARQKSLKREVAIKMLQQGLLASEKEVERFRTEAEAIANLQHPNIIAIHEVGEEAGMSYFCMEYVEGTDLAKIVDRGIVEQRRAAMYVKVIAEAVNYAHERGIVHRDLKPSNILIDKRGKIKIGDFGLAKRVESDTKVTATGAIVGTPSYMSPEQALGKRELIGTRSDVYSLGAILYELLTARPPFQAATVFETANLVINSEVVTPKLLNPKIDKDIETICLKCLEKNTERRYETAQKLAEDLERYLAGRPIEARPLSKIGKAIKWSRQNRWVAATMAAMFLLTMISVYSFFAYRNRLWESLLEQGIAERKADNRKASLEKIVQAAKIKKTPELRQAAIETIITPGLEPLYELPGNVEPSFLSSKFLAINRETITGDRKNMFTFLDTLSGKELSTKKIMYLNGLVDPTGSIIAIPKREENKITLFDPIKNKDIATFNTDPNSKWENRYTLHLFGDRCHCVPFLFSAKSTFLITNSKSSFAVIPLRDKSKPIDYFAGEPITFISEDKLLIRLEQNEVIDSLISLFSVVKNGLEESLKQDEGKEKYKARLSWIEFVSKHTETYRQIYYGEGGKLSSNYRPFVVLDLTTGKQEVLSNPKIDYLDIVVRNKNGNTLMFRSNEDPNHLIVWDALMLKEIGSINASGIFNSKRNEYDYLPSISNNGKYIALPSSYDNVNVVQLWKVDSLGLSKELIVLPLGTKVYGEWSSKPSMSFSPDGNLFAAIIEEPGSNEYCYVWDCKTGNQIGKVKAEIHYWLNSQILYAQNQIDGRKIWKINYPVSTYLTPKKYYVSNDRSFDEPFFSSDGKRLRVDNISYTLEKSDLNLQLTFPEKLVDFSKLDWSQDRRYRSLSSQGSFGVASWMDSSHHSYSSQNGLETAIREDRIKLSRVVPKKQEITLECCNHYSDLPVLGSDLRSMKISPNGKYLVVDRTLILPRLDTYKIGVNVDRDSSHVDGNGSNRDGFGYFTKNYTEIWDLDQQKVVHLLRPFNYGVNLFENGNVTFISDSKLMYIDYEKNSIVIFDVSTGTKQYINRPPGNYSMGRLDTTDGDKYLFTNIYNRNDKPMIVGIDLKTGKWRWRQNINAYTSAVSKDGKYLAATKSGILYLLDAETGRELARWKAHSDSLELKIAFSPDGGTLASISSDGILKLWNLTFIRQQLASLGLE